jgi:23S rRNA pseudouridine1911/1915/1917 synthase
MPEKIIFKVRIAARIDQVLQGEFADYSRSFLQKILEKGCVFIDGVPVQKKAQKLRFDQEIEVNFPDPEPLETPVENLQLPVLYEDDDVIVICKPPGMLTHPLHSGQGGTVVNGLLHILQGRLSSIGGVLRPGIVHRLDRETSGVLVAAKHDQAHWSLQSSFAERRVHKIYYALCGGRRGEVSGEIKLPLGRHPQRRMLRCVTPDGKPAHSAYRVLRSYNGFNLVRVQIFTGRTHQVRVHLKSVGLPILNDQDYGGRVLNGGVRRVLLHSFQLGFPHPVTGVYMRFICPFPEDMLQVMQQLELNRPYKGEDYV